MENTIVIINGTELELDLFDLDTMEKVETGIKEIFTVPKNVENLSTYEQYKSQCDMVYDFIDEVFGDGTADEVLGKKVNYRVCLHALTEIIEQIYKQRTFMEAEIEKSTNIIKEFSNEETPKLNRSQRRSKRK